MSSSTTHAAALHRARVLFPAGRRRGLLRPCAPDDGGWARRITRDLLLALGSILSVGGMAVLWIAVEVHSGDTSVPLVAWIGSLAALALGGLVSFAYRPRGRRHRPITEWARGAGFTAAPIATLDEVVVPELRRVQEASTRSGHLLQGLLGPDRVPAIAGGVHVMGRDSDGDPVVVASTGPFVAVPLPDDVAALLPSSRFVRRSRRADERVLLRRLRGGRGMRLESIRLDEAGDLQVSGGDELTWRMAFDPPAVAALSWDLDVEWTHEAGWLVVRIHGRAKEIVDPLVDVRLLDTLCAGAVLLERRFRAAASSTLGRRIPPAPVPPLLAASYSRARAHKAAVHLRRERRRDLALSIDEQLVELGRFTSVGEVERVRAALDDGSFRVDHLDDLIHHRRARFWGAEDAA